MLDGLSLGRLGPDDKDLGPAERKIGRLLADKVDVRKEGFLVLLVKYVKETVELEELAGGVAQDPLRVFADKTNGKTAWFARLHFFKGNENAKGLDSSGGLDRFVLAAKKLAVATSDDGMAFVGNDVLETAGDHGARSVVVEWRG